MTKKKIDAFSGKVSDLRKKLDERKQMGKKVEELRDKGFDREFLKTLTVERFEELYGEYRTVTDTIDDKRMEYYTQLVDAVDDWSFEEVFVYTLDILNAKLIEIAEENLPKGSKVEVPDVFPKLYNPIYQKCIERLKDKYEKKE